MCDSGWGGGAEEGLKHCAMMRKIDSVPTDYFYITFCEFSICLGQINDGSRGEDTENVNELACGELSAHECSMERRVLSFFTVWVQITAGSLPCPFSLLNH